MTTATSRLSVVGNHHTDQAGRSESTGNPLLDLVSGLPVKLTNADTDLIAWVNGRPTVLAPDADLGQASPGQLNLDWFAEYVGKHGKTDGERAVGLAGALTRYVLPYVVEWALDRAPNLRTVTDFTFARGTGLAEILAGQQPLPAATVAGDLLGRRAAACIWLTPPDAGSVSHGGLAAVHGRISARDLPTHRDSSGHVLIRAADLRGLGLLIEPEQAHGVAKGTADNDLFPFKQAMLRASDHGVQVRGDYRRLQSIDPLLDDRLRAPREDAGYFSLPTVRAIATHLTVVHQIVLWMLRLTGMRIGEAYGLLVADFIQTADGDRCLLINKQGGTPTVVRSKRDGKYHRGQHKPRTKTGEPRTIRVPAMLTDLLLLVIEIFHTDPDGQVRTEDRLIPGLRADDKSGAAGFRNKLQDAVAAAGVDRPIPHDFRGNLITDLENAQIQRRLAEYYTGHREDKRSVHEAYDDGVPVELQKPVTDAVAALVSAVSIEGLIVPTALVESWGVGTTMWRRRDEIRTRMSELGWVSWPEGLDPQASLLRTEEVADRIGLSQIQVRRMYKSGEITAQMYVIGGVRTWLADVTDVEAFLDRRSELTLGELAEQVGQTYHQTLALCTRLGLLPSDRRTGTAIRLGHDAVGAVRAELDRRHGGAEESMDLHEAAACLGLPLGQIEKLLRSGDLQQVPDPRGARKRYVSKASVARFVAHTPSSTNGTDTALVPFTRAHQIMGLSRLQLSGLVTTRQLHATTIDRRQHIGLQSALEYARTRALPQHVRDDLAAAAVQR